MGQWRDIDDDPFSVSIAAKPTEPTGFGSAFSQGFKRSLPETQSLLYGATAALGGAVGADSVRDWGLKHYQRIHDNEVAPLANQNTFQGSVKGDHSLGQWAGDTLGNFAGQGLQSAAAGLAGAIIGGANPTGPVGATVGGIGGVIAKEGGKKLIQRQVRQLMKEQVAAGASRTAARQAGNDLAKRRLAQMGGGALASTGLNIGQEIGIGYSQRAQDAQAAGEALTRQDALRAIGWGIPAGLVDSAAEIVTAGRLLRGASASSHLPRRLLAGATVGAATEGATEGIQAVMERAGANQSLTGPEAVDDYIENIAAGALGGGAMGGASGIRRASAESTNAPAVVNTPADPPKARVPLYAPPNAPTAITPSSLTPADAAVRAPNAPFTHRTDNPLARGVSVLDASAANTSIAAPVTRNTHLARRTLSGEVLDPQARLAPQREALPAPQAPIIEGEFTDLSQPSQRPIVPSTRDPNTPATTDTSTSSQTQAHPRALVPTDTRAPITPAITHPTPAASSDSTHTVPIGPLTRALNRLDHTPDLPPYSDNPFPTAQRLTATHQPPHTAPSTHPLALPAPPRQSTTAPHSATHPAHSTDSTHPAPPTPSAVPQQGQRPSLQDASANVLIRSARSLFACSHRR